MPANDLNATVVLLANLGAARDKLRQAVLNAGGNIVLETEPANADAGQVLAANPAAVVIALDASTDQALDRLEPVLDQAGVMVLLEEAELAAQREGWDAQRWERHLAAKLQGHGNVLPPGAEDEQVLHPQPGKPATPAQSHADATLHPHLAQAEAFASAVPNDALQLQADEDLPVLVDGQWTSLDTDAGLSVDQAGLDLSFEPAAQATFNSFESADYQPPAAADVVAPSLEELLASAPAVPAPVVESSAVMPPPLPPPLPAAAVEPVPVAQAKVESAAAPTSLDKWALVDFDSSAPAPAPAPAPVEPARQWDLSSLSLMDLDVQTDAEPGADGNVAGPAATAVALVMAGIGGPDAIRRLLAQLPAEGMPGAVLVQLRLDGGRYANLVAQLQRVSAAPVLLAEAGKTLQAGHVYVVSDEITLGSGQPLRFDTLAPMASVLADVPADGGVVLMLSGADADQVDAVLRLAERGAWVAGQSGEGCYDPAAASALAVAGMPIGEPAWLARELLARWGL